MFQSAQFELARLEHDHGGGQWHEMYEVSDAHDPAEKDPERGWREGKIFRCSTCQDQIRVVTPNPMPVEGSRAT